MLTKEQITDKINYIGGSDAAAVLGLSRWGSPLSVWAEKTDLIPQKELDSEAVELGRELEDYVARRFMRKTDKKVHRVNEAIQHPAYPFLRVNLDRRVVGERAFLECKTTSAWKAKEWEGEEIPTEYIIQCMHGLAVTGLDRCYIAVLIGNQDFKWKTIERDNKALSDMVKREVRFWSEFIVPKVMPEITSWKEKDTLNQLFPAAEEEKIITLDDKVNAMLESLEGLEADEKALGMQIEKAKNEIKAIMGTATKGETDLWGVAWRNRRLGGIDQKLLQAKHPEIYKKFQRDGTTRIFRYWKLDKGENENG